MPAPKNIPVLDMTPIGHNPDHTPIYRFHVGFPTNGVSVGEQPFDTLEAAWESGAAFVSEYARKHFPGGMGFVLGVTLKEGKYHAVTVRYYSNS